MTIFRFSVAFAGLIMSVGASSQPIELQPRSDLERTLLGDAENAKMELLALIAQHKNERSEIVPKLLSAGFEPDRGSPNCDFYGYYRQTNVDGSARSAQVALCRSGDPMVLVLDMLPRSKQGNGFIIQRQDSVK